MLPDRSTLKRQRLVESAKIEKDKCDILSNFQTLWSNCSNVEKKLKLHPPFSSSKLLFSSWSSGCPIDERIGHRRMQWLAQTGRTRMAGWPGYGCAMTSDAVPLLHNALASLWYTLGQKTHFLSINSLEFDMSNNVIFVKNEIFRMQFLWKLISKIGFLWKMRFRKCDFCWKMWF